jgi:phosphoribosylanthranilate isomerase
MPSGLSAGRTRLKVCCIASLEEARMAMAAGADALGLVGRMPSGPGPIPDERIAAIARRIPPPVTGILLTSETDPEAVIAHVGRCQPHAVQLVDTVPPETWAALRRQFPALRILQVIHVTGPEALEAAAAAAPHVDALLLDSGRPSLAVKELGGTGRVHDWTLSAQITAASPLPVFLAGGITPTNVAAAIRTVHPFAIDLCSGVRTDGKLDEAKLTALVQAIRSGE